MDYSKLPKLYYRYGRLSDNNIRERLKNIDLVTLTNKGVDSVYGYYKIDDGLRDRILDEPRIISTNFSEKDNLGDLIPNLKVVHKINFLCKSSSRFFLKADIGEILDQFYDFEVDNYSAICVELDDYQEIDGTEGEHFYCTASLLK